MIFWKSFSLSILVGFFIGAAFLGYIVFAYDSPSSSPPTQNIDNIPINIGSENQIKSGDLLTNALGATDGVRVGGYLQLAETDGAPPVGDCNCDGEVECGGDERGRMKYDPTADALFACNGTSGWITINAGAAVTCYRDADEDGRTTSAFTASIGSCPIGYALTQTEDDCDDNNANIWRFNYADVDADGYGDPATGVCGTDSIGSGRVANNSDCLDTGSKGPDYYPGNTAWYDSTASGVVGGLPWDHNCSGVEDRKPRSYITCQTVMSAGDKGCWVTNNFNVGASTACGQLGWYNSCVYEGDGGCHSLGVNSFYQVCR